MRRLLWQLSAALLGALLFCSPLQCAQTSYMPRKPLIYGICPAPFPALLKFDYPLCRADAWLKALGMAQNRLPQNLAGQDLGLDRELTRLGLSSLVFPLDVATPEKAAAEQTRVFLINPDDLNQKINEVMANSQILLLAMCLVWETRKTVDAMHADWPKDLASAAAALPRLEKLAATLDELWQIRSQLENMQSGQKPVWPQVAQGAEQSLISLLEQSRETGNLASIEQALGLANQREATGDAAASLWLRLAAEALALRASAHLASGQRGLAEADLNAAIGRWQASQGHANAEIYLARANLRRQLGNISGMCEDFAAACAQKQCLGLADARRQGQCLGIRP